MRVQIYDKGDGHYIALQKQRTGVEGKGYETCEVGEGYAQTTPDGETYIDLTIRGLTNNKTEYGDNG